MKLIVTLSNLCRVPNSENTKVCPVQKNGTLWTRRYPSLKLMAFLNCIGLTLRCWRKSIRFGYRSLIVKKKNLIISRSLWAAQHKPNSGNYTNQNANSKTKLTRLCLILGMLILKGVNKCILIQELLK